MPRYWSLLDCQAKGDRSHFRTSLHNWFPCPNSTSASPCWSRKPPWLASTKNIYFLNIILNCHCWSPTLLVPRILHGHLSFISNQSSQHHGPIASQTRKPGWQTTTLLINRWFIHKLSSWDEWQRWCKRGERTGHGFASLEQSIRSQK